MAILELSGMTVLLLKTSNSGTSGLSHYLSDVRYKAWIKTHATFEDVI